MIRVRLLEPNCERQDGVRRFLVLGIIISAYSQCPETGKLSLKQRGPLMSLVGALSSQTQYSIPVCGDYERKAISVSLRDATYYEVLDAICRVQADMSYFTLELGELRSRHALAPRKWIELQSSYSQHFKIGVIRYIRRQIDAPDHNSLYDEITLGVFAPPWITVYSGFGCVLDCRLDKAVDDVDHDLLLVAKPSDGSDSVRAKELDSGMVRSASFAIRTPKSGKCIKLLTGSVSISARRDSSVRLEAKAGATGDLGSGATITLKGIGDLSTESNVKRAEFRITPDKESAQTKVDGYLRGRLRTDTQATWTPFEFPSYGLTFQCDLPAAFSWVEFSLPGEKRTYNIPFEFKDVKTFGVRQ